MYMLTFLCVCFLDIPLGDLIDRYPLKNSILIAVTASFVSQIVLALMLNFRPSGYFYIILICRALFGLAGEAAYNIQGIILPKYSKNNY